MGENQVEQNGTDSNGVAHEAVAVKAEVVAIKAEATSQIVIPTAKLGEINVTPYMRAALDKVAVAEGFVNYEINVIHGSGVGDGFVGLVFRAIIQENESDKKLIVVVKTPPENQARRAMMGSLELFEREVRIYTEVLPAFVNFQKMMNVKPELGFFEFPKCFFAEYSKEQDDSIIIMEDLKESGYKMWDKFKPTNFEHAKLIFSALGRLHAVSFAMKELQPESFEPLKAFGDLLAPKMGEENFKMMLTGMIDRAIGTLDENDTRRRNRVLRLKEDLPSMMIEVTSGAKAEPFAVLGHGDCWSNNFMYQYKVSSIIVYF